MLPIRIRFDKWCDRRMGRYKHKGRLILGNYESGIGGSKNATQTVGDIWFQVQMESDISSGREDGKRYLWQTKQFNSSWKTGKEDHAFKEVEHPQWKNRVTREQPGDENGKMSLGLVRNLCHIPMFECDTAGNRELKLFEQDSEVLGFVF